MISGAAKSILIAGCLAMSGGGAACAAGVNGYHTVDIDPFANAGTSGVHKPRTEMARAVRALKAKDYRFAANAADHIVEASPGNVYGWQLLGVALAGRADWRGSERAYARAVKLSPDDPVSHAGLGVALARRGDPSARAELDWLKARAQACGDGCPDAVRLNALASSVAGALGT